jgi:hypothetical protein
MGSKILKLTIAKNLLSLRDNAKMEDTHELRPETLFRERCSGTWPCVGMSGA